MPHSDQDKEVLPRRDALKTLAAVTGAVTIASLPKNWQTPLVEVGALPAHAQISPCGVTGSLQVIAVTTTLVEGEVGSQFADFDVWGTTPDNSDVFYGNRGPHQGLSLNWDNIDFDPHINNESLTIPPGGAVTGTYRIGIWNQEFVPVQVTVTITTEQCTFTFARTLSGNEFEWVVADVSYPGGTVTAVNTVSSASRDGSAKSR